MGFVAARMSGALPKELSASQVAVVVAAANVVPASRAERRHAKCNETEIAPWRRRNQNRDGRDVTKSADRVTHGPRSRQDKFGATDDLVDLSLRSENRLVHTRNTL